MGEKAHLPSDNGMPKPNGDSGNQENEDQHMNSDPEEGDDLDDMSPEEFQMLDNQLDALNSALDSIEQKNDDIHAQLLQLLQSNREIRKQIQDANTSGGTDQQQQPPEQSEQK